MLNWCSTQKTIGIMLKIKIKIKKALIENCDSIPDFIIDILFKTLKLKNL
jgi:hypothetical protein